MHVNVPYCRVSNLPYGQPFLYKDRFYMRVSLRNYPLVEDVCLVVELDQGAVTHMSEDTEVTPVQLESRVVEYIYD